MLAHQFEAAAKECHEVIKVDPGFTRSYFDLSEDYDLSGDHDRAIAAWEQGMRLAHENPATIEALRRPIEVAVMTPSLGGN